MPVLPITLVIIDGSTGRPLVLFMFAEDTRYTGKGPGLASCHAFLAFSRSIPRASAPRYGSAGVAAALRWAMRHDKAYVPPSPGFVMIKGSTTPQVCKCAPAFFPASRRVSDELGLVDRRPRPVRSIKPLLCNCWGNCRSIAPRTTGVSSTPGCHEESSNFQGSTVWDSCRSGASVPSTQLR
jgi:hypothetical protein